MDLDACYTLGGWARGQGRGGTGGRGGIKLSESYFFDNNYTSIFEIYANFWGSFFSPWLECLIENLQNSRKKSPLLENTKRVVQSWFS